MKTDCPHCAKKGISYFSKWWSGSTTPALCNQCNNFSYVNNGTRHYSFPTVINIIIAAFGVVGFILTQKLFLLCLLPLGYLISKIYLVLYSPMVKSTKKQIDANKRVGNFILLFLFSSLIIYKIIDFVT
jgi:hypothetical protein